MTLALRDKSGWSSDRRWISSLVRAKASQSSWSRQAENVRLSVTVGRAQTNRRWGRESIVADPESVSNLPRELGAGLGVAPSSSGTRSWTMVVWRRLGPPARRADYARARRTARDLASEFAEKGARAVLLSGSWARREARRSSDLDLWVLGKAGEPTFF